MDNTPDKWAQDSIEWALENKIIIGDEYGDLKLHQTCTRQDMLVFLNRLFDLLEVD